MTFKFISTNKKFYFDDTPEGRKAYLQRTKKIIEESYQVLSQQAYFHQLPTTRLLVKPVEHFREKSAPVAFYERPDNKGQRPGVYYVNLHRMESLPRYRMRALAYHESLPGHHLQVASVIENDALPRFRRYGHYSAYSEGWGMYAEWLAGEMGLYQTTEDRLGQLTLDLWRSSRLVVDTGLHARQWRRDEAINYLVENTPFSEDEATKQIDRYVVMPGQALSYKIGQLKLLALKDKVQARLGDEFSYADFHQLILSNGPLPLNILEQQVDLWLQSF